MKEALLENSGFNHVSVPDFHLSESVRLNIDGDLDFSLHLYNTVMVTSEERCLPEETACGDGWIQGFHLHWDKVNLK